MNLVVTLCTIDLEGYSVFLEEHTGESETFSNGITIEFTQKTKDLLATGAQILVTLEYS